MKILKIILAIFIPPVAAFLQVGISTHFWINIALTLLGGIPGIVHALWLVLTGKECDQKSITKDLYFSMEYNLQNYFMNQ